MVICVFAYFTYLSCVLLILQVYSHGYYLTKVLRVSYYTTYVVLGFCSSMILVLMFTGPHNRMVWYTFILPIILGLIWLSVGHLTIHGS